MLVLLSGMPGCVNSALCNEILKKSPGGFSDNHSLHFISENLFEGIEHMRRYLNLLGCFIHCNKTWVQ
jgi:hypothetical protein